MVLRQTVDWRVQCPHWKHLLLLRYSPQERFRRSYVAQFPVAIAPVSQLPKTTYRFIGILCFGGRVFRMDRNNLWLVQPFPSRTLWVWSPCQWGNFKLWCPCLHNRSDGWLAFLSKVTRRAAMHEALWILGCIRGIARGQTLMPTPWLCRRGFAVWPSTLRMVRRFCNLTVS